MFEPGKGNSTTYGFNLVINARASKEKQEVLHDLYRFIMSDPLDCWKDTAPFTLARKSGWADNPAGQGLPVRRRDHQRQGRGRVRCRARWSTTRWPTPCIARVQQIMLNNADIKTSLDEAAAEVDRATGHYKKG